MTRIGVSVVLCAISFPLAGQEGQPAQVSPEQRRLVYVPLGPRPAKPIEPEPGDEFTVDNARKEIVIGHRVPLVFFRATGSRFSPTSIRR